MPTSPYSASLIEMWAIDEAPWKWPKWQKRTGTHDGLFPDDDALLPTGWTRQDAKEIYSYFGSFLSIMKPDPRLKLHNSKAGAYPGRDKWKRWVNSALRKWELHSLIVEAFDDNNINPNEIYRTNGFWPNSSTFLSSALDSVGTKLFGEECLDETGHLYLLVRAPVLAIAQNTWSLLRNQNKRAENRLLSVEAAALDAFEEASGVSPSKDCIACAIRAMAKWRNLAEVAGNVEKLLKIDENIERLEELMASVGAVVNADDRKIGPKSTYRHTAQLASQQDVDFLVCLYQDLLDAPDDDSPPLEPGPLLDIDIAPLEGSMSLGVGPEMKMNPEQLADELGFKDGLPFLFNKFRHKLGFVAWDQPNLFDNPNGNSDITPLNLHWHQLAGLHAIIRQTFTAVPGEIETPGILVADDVGLGKTGIAISMMGFLSHLVNLHQLRHPMPKVIQRKPFLGGNNVLPDRPHLVLVPGTLLAQWVSELKVFFQNHVVDILVYPTKGAQHASFWASNGPYETSKYWPSQRIIVASHSSLLQDYSASFKSGKAGKLPWDLHGPKHGAKLQDTLYGKEFLCSIFDEGHLFRNIGKKQLSVLRIAKCSLLTLALTATPVQTKTGDAASMGRLIGIPYFLSAEAHADEKAHAAALRKAKKEASEEMDDDDIPSYNSVVRRVQVESSLRMQKHFEGRIIRRTIQSTDWQNNNLLNLPPIKRIKAILKLTDREMQIINCLAESAKEDVSAANGAGKFLTKKFYVDYRMACGFAWEEGPLPKISSFENWQVCLSTKMDVAARVIRHHLARDDAPDVAFKDGKAVFPPLPSTPDFTRTMKIVIFQLFPSLRAPLTQCLSLYGVESMAIDGAKSYDRRAATVAAFKDSKTCRVLIISSVGSAGLNLAFCSCVIYIDQTWSSQDERQIDGRVWRQPQDKEVRIYHMLADQTSDIMLSGMASTKRDMLEAFLDKDAGEELIQLLSGQVVLANDEDSDEELSVSKKRSTSSLNSDNGIETEEGGNDNKKGKGKKTAKRRQKSTSKRPLILEPSPEPEESPSALTAIRGPDDHTAFDEDASDGGTNSNSRMSDGFTSDSEGAAMDLDTNQLHIQSAKSLLQGTKRPRQQSPPAKPTDRASKGNQVNGLAMDLDINQLHIQSAKSSFQGAKRPRRQSPPPAEPTDQTSKGSQVVHSDSDEMPIKIKRVKPTPRGSHQFSVQPPRPLTVAAGLEGHTLTPRKQAQQLVVQRALPKGGSQKLYRPHSSGKRFSNQPPPSKDSPFFGPDVHPDRVFNEPPEEAESELVSNTRASANSVAGPSSARRSATPIAPITPNTSLMTPPAQPFGIPPMNPPRATGQRRAATPSGAGNLLSGLRKNSDFPFGRASGQKGAIRRGQSQG